MKQTERRLSELANGQRSRGAGRGFEKHSAESLSYASRYEARHWGAFMLYRRQQVGRWHTSKAWDYADWGGVVQPRAFARL
jgi:hypothetical protein